MNRLTCIVAAAFLLACDTPTPTAPAPVSPLVGWWQYTGNNFEDPVAQKIERYVIDQGDPLGIAAEIATEVTEGMLSKFPQVLIFNADGTYLAEGAVGGQWTAVDDRLTLMEGKARGTYRYTVVGNTLTVIVDPADFFVLRPFTGILESLDTPEFRFTRQ